MRVLFGFWEGNKHRRGYERCKSERRKRNDEICVWVCSWLFVCFLLRFFLRFFVLFFLVSSPSHCLSPLLERPLAEGMAVSALGRQEGEKKTTQKTNNTKNYTKRLGEFVSWSVFTAHQSLTGETTRRRDGVSTFHCYFFPSLLERPLAEGWEEMIGTWCGDTNRYNHNQFCLEFLHRTASSPLLERPLAEGGMVVLSSLVITASFFVSYWRDHLQKEWKKPLLERPLAEGTRRGVNTMVVGTMRDKRNKTITKNQLWFLFFVFCCVFCFCCLVFCFCFGCFGSVFINHNLTPLTGETTCRRGVSCVHLSKPLTGETTCRRGVESVHV